MQAFEKDNQLAPLFSNPQTCAETLRHQVSEIAGSGKRQKGSALKLVPIDEPSIQPLSPYTKSFEEDGVLIDLLKPAGLHIRQLNTQYDIDRARPPFVSS